MIKSQNKKLINAGQQDIKECNCRKKESCRLEGTCRSEKTVQMYKNNNWSTAKNTRK